MAALLACGPAAALSHGSAAAFRGVVADRDGPIDVSVPGVRAPTSRMVIRVHRRSSSGSRRRRAAERHPAEPASVAPSSTSRPAAGRLAGSSAAINEADRLDLIDPEALRTGAGGIRRPTRRRAVAHACSTAAPSPLTDSELERRFLPVAADGGAAAVRLTRRRVNGYKVDFYWPGLGLRGRDRRPAISPHAAAQARDRLRDQAHAVAGLTALRFTHRRSNSSRRTSARRSARRRAA